MNTRKQIALFILCTSNLFAQEKVTISWDPVKSLKDGTPASEPIGYRVFAGTESRRYADSVYIAPSVFVLVNGMLKADMRVEPFAEHFFAVRAYNSAGASEFSEEVSKYVFVTRRPERARVRLSGGSSKALAVGRLSRYSFFELHAGDPYYSDRAYVLKDLPKFLESAVAIKTKNANEDKQSVSPSWIEFDVNVAVDVFIFYNRSLLPPSWIGEDTGLKAGTTDAGVGFFKIYKNSFEAGRVVLGGNEAPSNQSMYFAAILPQAKTEVF